MGTHAALLYHISSAMKAFQEDLRKLGIEDRVLTMTFSEFGRRALSNGSFGSDHGTAAPMFIFGRYANPGVIGSNANLNDLDRGNLKHQFDYRQVFTSVLKDWLQADEAALDATMFSDWVDSRLPIINDGPLSTKKEFFDQRFHLRDCYPNPVADRTTFILVMNSSSRVRLEITDIQGSPLKALYSGDLPAGRSELSYDLSDLPAGIYLYSLKSAQFSDSKRLMKL
jgi:hypothetical protein